MKGLYMLSLVKWQDSTFSKKQFMFLFYLIIVSMTLNGCTSHKPQPLPPPSTNPEQIVAIVNGQPIFRKELDDQIRYLILAREARKEDPVMIARSRPRIEIEARDSLVSEMIVQQAVIKEGLQPSTQTVTNAINAIHQFMQSSGIPFHELEDKSELTETQMYERVSTLIGVQAFYSKLLKIPEPTENDIQTYYKNNSQMYLQPEGAKVSRILISFGSDNPSMLTKMNARRKIDNIYDRLLKGERFEDLAKEASEALEAKEGGDMGWIFPAQEASAFNDAAFKQEIGIINPPFETPAGMVLLLVRERRQSKIIPLDEIRPLVRFAYMASQLKTHASEIGKVFKTIYDEAKIEYP